MTDAANTTRVTAPRPAPTTGLPRTGHVGTPKRDRRTAALDRIMRELAELHRTRTRITAAVWTVASGVMIYGAVNVTGLLADHGAHPGIAWLLSMMVDVALCIALWSDRILQRHRRRDRWVTALRWVTATLTLVLNTARPALHTTDPDGPTHGTPLWTPDWVGVGVHAVGPILLMIVAEAAGSIQRHLTDIISELEQRASTLNQPALPPGPDTSPVRRADQPVAADPAPVNGTAIRPTTVRPGPPSAAAATPGRRPSAAGRSQQSTPSAHDDSRTSTEAMWTHWRRERDAGRTPSGAELDRAAGTNNYGRSVLRKWHQTGRITTAELEAAKHAGRKRSQPPMPAEPPLGQPEGAP